MVYSWYILVFSLAIAVHIGGTEMRYTEFLVKSYFISLTTFHMYLTTFLAKFITHPIVYFTNSSFFISPKIMDSNNPLGLIKFVIDSYNLSIKVFSLYYWLYIYIYKDV